MTAEYFCLFHYCRVNACQRYYDVIGKNENPVRDDISVEE